LEEKKQSEGEGLVLTQDTETITDLFSRDPVSWSDADMARMVAHYREQRVKLDALPDKKKKTATPKVAIEGSASGSDVLKSLGL
jgi:hypothetical protein